jgi:hypothetical protein
MNVVGTSGYRLQKVGLLWIGEAFYKSTHAFMEEARRLGISRRIPAVPNDFEAGKTWVILAHPKACACPECKGAGLILPKKNGERPVECGRCEATGAVPGAFYVFRPTGVEKIVTDVQAKDEEEMEKLRKRGITPFVVPASDPDHAAPSRGGDEEEDAA